MGSITPKLTAPFLAAAVLLAVVWSMFSIENVQAQYVCEIAVGLDQIEEPEGWSTGGDPGGFYWLIYTDTVPTQLDIDPDVLISSCGYNPVDYGIVSNDQAYANISMMSGSGTFTLSVTAGVETAVITDYVTLGSFGSDLVWPATGTVTAVSLALDPDTPPVSFFGVSFSLPHSMFVYSGSAPRPTPLPTPIITGSLPGPPSDTIYSDYTASGVLSGTFVLPEPLEIPDYEGPVLNVEPIMNLGNLLGLIQTIRTFPVLLERYKLLTVFMLVGGALIAFRFIANAVNGSKERQRELPESQPRQVSYRRFRR